MALGDIFQLAAVYDVVGAAGEIVNVYNYRQTVYDGFSGDFPEADLLANIFGASLVANLVPALSTSISLNRVDFFIVNKPTVGGTAPIGVTGSAIIQMLPIRSAPVIKKVTGARGRSFQGRNYLPPLTEDVQDAGVISPSMITVLDVYANALLVLDDAGFINQWQQTIYSSTLSTPPTLFVDTLVVDVIVNNRLGTIRGRQNV